MRRRYGALAALAVASCTFGSLDGLAGPASDPPDASVDSPAPSDALVPPSDTAPEITPDGALVYPSCATVPAGSPSGIYNLDPDGSGPTPVFQAYCDMTNDGGGWMLVTAAMLGQETNVLSTPTRESDGNGGLVLTVYVNSRGCGTGLESRYLIYINDAPRWSQIRYHQLFHGSASCWHTFGGQENGTQMQLLPNIVPFTATVDTIRDQIRMGGSNGDAFDGMDSRCDNTSENFWEAQNGDDPRSATVVLRRAQLSSPAGLETGANCGEFGPGTTSLLFWQYSDIFVK